MTRYPDKINKRKICLWKTKLQSIVVGFGMLVLPLWRFSSLPANNKPVQCEDQLWRGWGWLIVRLSTPPETPFIHGIQLWSGANNNCCRDSSSQIWVRYDPLLHVWIPAKIIYKKKSDITAAFHTENNHWQHDGHISMNGIKPNNWFIETNITCSCMHMSYLLCSSACCQTHHNSV